MKYENYWNKYKDYLIKLKGNLVLLFFLSFSLWGQEIKIAPMAPFAPPPYEYIPFLEEDYTNDMRHSSGFYSSLWKERPWGKKTLELFKEDIEINPHIIYVPGFYNHYVHCFRCSPEEHKERRCTPLNQLFYNPHAKIFEILIHNGIDFNKLQSNPTQHCYETQSSLYSLCRLAMNNYDCYRYKASINVLLKNGINPDRGIYKQRGALHTSPLTIVMWKTLQEYILSTVRNDYYDPDDQDSVIELEERIEEEKEIKKDRLDIARLLIKHGADINRAHYELRQLRIPPYQEEILQAVQQELTLLQSELLHPFTKGQNIVTALRARQTSAKLMPRKKQKKRKRGINDE